MQQRQVGGRQHRLAGDGAPAIARADRQSPAAGRLRPHAFDQLVDALGLEDLVLVARVALIVDLDDHVRMARIQQPADGAVDGPDHGRLVAESLVLPLVEEADDRDHAQLVQPVEDAPQALQIGGPHITSRAEGAVLQGCAFE